MSGRRHLLERSMRPRVRPGLLGQGVWQRRLRWPVRNVHVAGDLREWEGVLSAPVLGASVRKRWRRRDLRDVLRGLGLRRDPVHLPGHRRGGLSGRRTAEGARCQVGVS